jgi:hypothetical protein
MPEWLIQYIENMIFAYWIKKYPAVNGTQITVARLQKSVSLAS